MQAQLASIVDEVRKVIVGKDEVIEKVLMVIIAGGHILLDDVPGVGKTMLALSFSKALDLDYKRIQFTPDTMASDIMGFSVYDKDTRELTFKKGAAFCNLFLADEVNRTSSRTQAALLEVMEERNVTLDGVTHALPDPFIVIATQNPVGSAGTQRLPESQLDRFMVCLSIGYPDIKSQVRLVRERSGADPLTTVERCMGRDELSRLQKEVHAIDIHDDCIAYAAELCQETGKPESVDLGVSPRALLALIELAKARAYSEERSFVTPQDVQHFFIDVCAHRLVLSARARVRQEHEPTILQGILNKVKTPSLAHASSIQPKG
jgi:MoxR-like ATPase